MATTTKQYTISIQLNAAQQALVDTNKKLAELDKKLGGLDRNSDEAKKIVADMAALAKQSEAASSNVEGLNRRLDGLKPGTIGALKQELKDLTVQLNNTAEGSAEAEALLVRMGQVRGDIKGLKDEVKALDPEQRIAAFSNFAQGVVGAFGTATVAAEAFGLSSQSAEEFTKKTQGVIAVLGSLQAIQSALDGETIKSIKSTIGLGKAYLLGGESASTASKVTRGALISTGIGAIVVLVGLLAANFDKVKEIGSSIYAKFKPQFEGISRLIGTVIDAARNLASTVTFGLIDDAATHAVAVAKETADKLAVIANENRARRIAVLDAEGKETLGLKARQIAEELKQLKTSTAEEKKIFFDKYNELLVLEAQFNKRKKDEALAGDLARLNAQLAQQQARGGDGFKLQLALKQRELRGLLDAEQVNGAAVIAKQGEIEALKLAHQKTAADKRLAAEFEAFKKRVTETEKLEKISAQDRLRLDIAAETERETAVAARGQQMAAAAARVAEQQATDAAERVRVAALPKLSFTDNVLVRVFGVAPDQLDQTKGRIMAAAEAVNAVVGQFYAGAQAEADARVEEAQQRLSLVSQALAESQGKQATDEAALQTATGARRDFLLQKIAKERAEEEKLNAAKNRAAADEKKRLKEQQQLQKESQRISLATAAASAIQAAVTAIASAAAIPFPANIPAIIVAGATVGSAVFAAKALGNTFADGGFITGNGGPRADQVPALLSNGEFVVNADATAKNRALLESMNANNNRVLPPGTLGLASGATGGRAGDGLGSAAGEIAQLVAANQELIGLTRQLVGHAQVTAEKPPLLIGPAEALAFEEQRKSVVDAQRSAAL
ncbi:MAG TPA: hypothetical protein VF690_01200 [Hymenobacter sp.]